MDEKLPEHAPVNGWTFKIAHDPQRPVSWVYKDVKNYGYNFASEISIEKILVEVKKDDEQVETLSLKFSDFAGLNGEELAGFKEYNPKTVNYNMIVSNFAVYKGKGKLLAFKTRKGVLPSKEVEGKTVHERLYFFVTVLFGEYGSEPPHEFTSSLSAARFTPAIRFETKNESVLSVRVHYRFHFNVDSYLESVPALTKLAEDAKKKIWGIEQYASLLRDGDHFPPSLLATFMLMLELYSLFSDLKFFNLRLDDCGFGGSCEASTSQLKLEISDAATRTGDRLNISFRDPRTLLTDPAKALKKSSATVIDKKVKALSVGRARDYVQSAVDELTTRTFDAIVGKKKLAQGVDTFAGQALFPLEEQTPLPGITAACLNSNIKYLLVRLVIRKYLRRKAAIIAKHLQSVQENMGTDLAAIPKHLGPGDFEKVIRDMVGLAQAILQRPLAPVVGQLLTLKRLAELAESMGKLAGKIISIVGFDAAEKPALYEVVGTFVRGGEVSGTWDNLHLWGTEEIPSAPGAFHAVHTHFRWSQINTYPSAVEDALLKVGDAIAGAKKGLSNRAPQFRSLVKKFADNNLSGPLIDPHIPIQTISFALALNDGELDKKLKDKESKETFDKVSVKPGKIATVSELGNSGADIVYWLSCKATRTQEETFKGTLLVNGFYFAHDEESPLGLFRSGSMFALTRGVSLQKPKRQEPYTDLIRDPSPK